MAKKPTLQMVADRAGVSRGTVDRVINQRSYVKEEVRERVLQAIRDVGYVPLRMEQAKAVGLVPAGKPCTLGVLLPDWSGHFLREVTAGLDAAKGLLEDFGVRILAKQCETEIAEECMEKLDELLQNGAEGIALCTKNHPMIRAKIDMLAAEGIPVVTFNTDLPDCDRACFVGQDDRRSGRLAGELMSKCIPRNGYVLAAVGNLEFEGHKRRLQGFLDQMELRGFSEKQIEIVQTYNDYSLSYARVNEALARYPNLSGVYMANHSVTGCAEAIRAVGRQQMVRVISHDVTEGARRLLREDAIDFVIAQDLKRQGSRPLQILYNILRKGEKLAVDTEFLPLRIICAQNLDEQ